jgi:hypothetical protein
LFRTPHFSAGPSQASGFSSFQHSKLRQFARQWVLGASHGDDDDDDDSDFESSRAYQEGRLNWQATIHIIIILLAECNSIQPLLKQYLTAEFTQNLSDDSSFRSLALFIARYQVMAFLQASGDQELLRWAEQHCTFPNCMVGCRFKAFLKTFFEYKV